MKSKRKQFKMLVKECLLEILSENLVEQIVAKKLNEINFSQNSTQNVNLMQQTLNENSNNDLPAKMQEYKSTLNKVHYGELKNNEPSVTMNELGLENNDPMKAIFEDTMRTTVKKQAQAASPNVAVSDGGIDISKIANPNWATIAGVS